MKQKYLIIVLVSLAMGLFLWGTYRQGTRENDSLTKYDQSAYIYFVKRVVETDFNYTGTRSRMPIYPIIMALFYSEEMSDETFFEYGKVIGVVIALMVTSLTFFIFQRKAPIFDASIATLVVMFSVFAYKAPYFQPEILFYGINLVLFYFLISLLRKPRIGTAALAGITAGIGHLTKASVIPGLLLAGLCLLLSGVIFQKRQPSGTDTESFFLSGAKHLLRHISYVLVLFGCFLVVIFPYIQNSKEIYGHYFYNVNSTFYVWYDSYDEVKEGTRAHGDRVGWPDMPEDQIPSFQKYIQEHSNRDIVNRFVNGLTILWEWVVTSYGYAEFLAIYLVLIAFFIFQNLDWARSILSRIPPSLLLFILGYFSGHSLLYAWFIPIATGTRFILSLFLPALFLVVSFLSRAQSDDMKINIIGRELPASSISQFILIFLIAYLLAIYPARVSNMFGGM